MSLRDRLKARKLRETVLTIDGESYLVKELPKSRRLELIASCRDKAGVLDTEALENTCLCECVRDPETGETIFAATEKDEWNAIGAGVTSPLFAEVMKLNGMDNDDVGRTVKNSDTTGSSV